MNCDSSAILDAGASFGFAESIAIPKEQSPDGVGVTMMNSASFLGGIWKRGSTDRRRHAPPSVEAVNEDWGWVGQRAELFLRGAPACCRLFTWDGLAILLRGYARPATGSGPLDLERVAEELRCHYLEHGNLAVDEFEGSFTVALCDSHAEKIILYRNLIGSGSTYYHPTPDGFLFAGNLAELTDLIDRSLQPNRAALPAFFLFRCVPGRETLFTDFYRLLPGEQVCWDHRGFTRIQRQTFSSLHADLIPADEAIDCLEDTFAEVLADCNALRPGAANLLSGGVDSSYIQAIWNHRVYPGNELPTSYSISVDHPHTWPDSDYAITAAQALGTRHALVPADAPYANYLVDTLATTAEPLNHVQSAYFGQLARVMGADGVSAGLCGEGADSLFGLGLANQVHNASVLRTLFPGMACRRLGADVTAAIGWSRLAHTFRFADRLRDWAWLDHPVNRAAVFADWPAVEACFGATALAQAASDRRRLLDLFDVSTDPLDRMHAVGFLGEAMDSAGLWATLFHRAGVDLLCPFLDSRMVRLALNLPPQVRYRFRRPKDLLKRALARRAPAELATRVKLGFGQPIFEWLSAGGQLQPLIERIGRYDFVDPGTLRRVRQQPTWFLYSLVVYDNWHKLFIERSLPRQRGVSRGRCDATEQFHEPLLRHR
jgi:asparagine synthase (glutamine-hydrolysing)